MLYKIETNYLFLFKKHNKLKTNTNNSNNNNNVVPCIIY